ncbi:MAG: 2-isopropylmalate synthase, partial [uncultured Nocardioidaceae bacterium]
EGRPQARPAAAAPDRVLPCRAGAHRRRWRRGVARGDVALLRGDLPRAGEPAAAQLGAHLVGGRREGPAHRQRLRRGGAADPAGDRQRAHRGVRGGDQRARVRRTGARLRRACPVLRWRRDGRGVRGVRRGRPGAVGGRAGPEHRHCLAQGRGVRRQPGL